MGNNLSTKAKMYVPGLTRQVNECPFVLQVVELTGIPYITRYGATG
ncbi:MAG TPA: hypothetical protein PKN57_00420 [Saprospiraceae bacterium]|nr:hypothetical protein [Saprospiraceae bacterium]MCC6688462.1 hypothetical protein [Saprospiraceae bacterium]HMV23890.1 hypothetical protein [Saprospiraceae bacterium]HMW74548.1 hypothetical protein [Saprospiraceae bacterium]HMX83274.1 hypothetical protein [Saprospiraceae bacterium]